MRLIAALVLAQVAAAPAPPAIDGRKLALGDACYAVVDSATGQQRTAGAILRRVRPLGDDTLLITIISRFNGGPVLASNIEMSRTDLRPSAAREEQDGRLKSIIWYRFDRIFIDSYKPSGKFKRKTRRLTGPIWDAGAAEFILPAIALSEGAHVELPMFSVFTGTRTGVFDVTGSRLVTIGGATVDAWVVRVTSARTLPTSLLIAKDGQRLVGIEVDGVSSLLGGDCSGIPH